MDPNVPASGAGGIEDDSDEIQFLLHAVDTVAQEHASPPQVTADAMRSHVPGTLRLFLDEGEENPVPSHTSRWEGGHADPASLGYASTDGMGMSWDATRTSQDPAMRLQRQAAMGQHDYSNTHPPATHVLEDGTAYEAGRMMPALPIPNMGPTLTPTTFGLDIATLNARPWNAAGAKIDAYFNYGFTERTWMRYVSLQPGGSQAVLDKVYAVAGGGYHWDAMLCSVVGAGGASGMPLHGAGMHQQQQQQPNSFYKTRLCRAFGTSVGCRFGAQCQYAHGEAELRAPMLIPPPSRVHGQEDSAGAWGMGPGDPTTQPQATSGEWMNTPGWSTAALGRHGKTSGGSVAPSPPSATSRPTVSLKRDRGGEVPDPVRKGTGTYSI